MSVRLGLADCARPGALRLTQAVAGDRSFLLSQAEYYSVGRMGHDLLFYPAVGGQLRCFSLSAVVDGAAMYVGVRTPRLVPSSHHIILCSALKQENVDFS